MPIRLCGDTMRYVSKLVTTAGPVPSSNYITPDGWVLTNPLVSATVHSSGGSDIVVGPDELSQIDCIGNSGFDGVAVSYDAKTALLYKYVEEVWCQAGKPVVDISNIDHCASEQPGRVITGKSTEIAVDTGEGAVKFFGEHGSVVLKKSRYEVLASFMTLYELLGRLCRGYGLNFMRYDTIWLFSDLEYYTARIKLAHSPEADRYFAKMYMDVVKCGITSKKS